MMKVLLCYLLIFNLAAQTIEPDLDSDLDSDEMTEQEIETTTNEKVEKVSLRDKVVYQLKSVLLFDKFTEQAETLIKELASNIVSYEEVKISECNGELIEVVIDTTEAEGESKSPRKLTKEERKICLYELYKIKKQFLEAQEKIDLLEFDFLSQEFKKKIQARTKESIKQLDIQLKIND